MQKRLKVGFYQGFHGQGVPIDIAEIVIEESPDLFCLPEYFFVRPDEDSILQSAERHDIHLQYLRDLSERLNCAITGGTLVTEDNGDLKNRCYFIENKSLLDYYDKIHLFKKEGRGQIVPGHEYKVVQFGNVRVGLLVCADVLHKESFYNIRGLQPDFIVCPVTSPYRDGESSEEKYQRDKDLWIEAAYIARCPILKIGSVGKIAGRKLQGRSLLANSYSIQFRVNPEDEDKPLLKFIDLEL